MAPNNPFCPGKPSFPGVPGRPLFPGNPKLPLRPGKPGKPIKPGNPFDPSKTIHISNLDNIYLENFQMRDYNIILGLTVNG